MIRGAAALGLAATMGCSLHLSTVGDAPAGEARRELEGTYVAEVTELSSPCRGRRDSRRSEAEAYYVPNVRGRPVFRLVIEDIIYDVDLQPGGKFEGKPLQSAARYNVDVQPGGTFEGTPLQSPARAAVTRALKGEFKDRAFAAQVTVRWTPVRTPCHYTLYIEATRK